jgi:putative ABC transport system substrate-binding protein
LAATGYVDGHNVAVEYQWAEGHTDRLPMLAAKLVRQQVAVIVTVGTPAALTAKAATRTIPIIFLMGSDPIEIGLAESFNRPGGNLTGIAILAAEMAAKRLSLLREFVPAAQCIAVLVNSANPIPETRDLHAAARVLGLRILVLDVETESEIASAFDTLVVQHASALLIGSDTLFTGLATRDQIILLANRHAVPTLFYDSAGVAAGGLSLWAESS